MSRVKGTGGVNCCCGGCASPPLDGDTLVGVSDRGPGVQRLQRLCLACAPHMLCVAVASGDKLYAALWGRVDPGCPGADPYDDKTYWTGFIPVGGDFVTGRLDIVVDDYDKCWLQLTSEEGRLLPDDASTWLELTTDVRRELDPGCLPCDYRPGGNLVWDVTVADKPVVITITIPCSVSLNNSSDCSGQSASCTPPDYEDVPISAGCGVHCVNCGCICGDAHVTVRINGKVASDVPVQMCNYIYSATPPHDQSQFPILAVEPDLYTSDCYLVLRSLGAIGDYGEIVVPTDASPLLLGSGALHCPRPYAQWTLSIGNKVVQVTFECAECGGDAGEIVSPPCCPDPLPRSLVFELDASACGCGNIAIPIVNTSPEGIFHWDGCSATDQLSCVPPPLNDVCISLGCGGNDSWTVGIKFTGDSEYHFYASTGGGCSPMSLEWGNINPQGIGICRPPTPGPYPLLTGRVSE